MFGFTFINKKKLAKIEHTAAKVAVENLHLNKRLIEIFAALSMYEKQYEEMEAKKLKGMAKELKSSKILRDLLDEIKQV